MLFNPDSLNNLKINRLFFQESGQNPPLYEQAWNLLTSKWRLRSKRITKAHINEYY